MSEPTQNNLSSFISRNRKRLALWVGGGIVVVLVLVVALFFVANLVITPTPERSDQVGAFIHEFETPITLVPLGATNEEIVAAMDTQYKKYLSSELLAAWKADPSKALGDPAGDTTYAGIRVKSIRNVGPLTYVVKAYLQERTPVTIPGLGTGLAKRDLPVTFGVAWRGFSWKIVEFTDGHGENATSTPAIP